MKARKQKNRERRCAAKWLRIGKRILGHHAIASIAVRCRAMGTGVKHGHDAHIGLAGIRVEGCVISDGDARVLCDYGVPIQFWNCTIFHGDARV